MIDANANCGGRDWDGQDPRFCGRRFHYFELRLKNTPTAPGPPPRCPTCRGREAQRRRADRKRVEVALCR